MRDKRCFVSASILVTVCLLLFGCAREDQNLAASLESITAEDLEDHIITLASDELEGRSPASPGEEKTVNYLREEFQNLGLKPGNDQSFFQEVPMVEITADPQVRLDIKKDEKTAAFRYGDDFMAWTLRVVREVSLAESDMIFVGYGIIAPEYGWNDYEGVDVRGKTVVMLVNDPGFVTGDPELFNGRAMTYYGRWTYKFEEAARQGASGAFIVHETEPASYPWEVVRNSWSGANFSLAAEDNNMSRCAVEGWITTDTACRLFQMAGQDYEKLKSDATKHGFRALPLGTKAFITLENKIKRSKSRNVIAVLPGSDRADEYIFYMAHWDHFGIDPTLEGDQIYNGARDNATGTAALIELAEAFNMLPTPPSRSIAFLAVTGEEQGLLGSKYYAAHPIYPPAKTVAAINMDALNIFGRMNDITVIGYGNSDLDHYVEAAAAEQGRTVRPDPHPERGSFYRSDHFSFAKQGIPALYTGCGVDHVEKGKEWGRSQIKKWGDAHYHKTSDEYDPHTWNLSGAIQDLRLLFRVGYELSQESTFPNWTQGSEFKAKRDKDMEAARHKSDR
ncbi:MAG: M28 family metallopeptidase [Candidatus Aminicenantes bacterium]